jgi:hypothetical protein
MRTELNEIKLKLDEMQELIDGDMSYEDEQRINEIYTDVIFLFDVTDDGSSEYSKLKKRFKKLSSEFENPDDLRQGNLNMMFPDDDF